MGRSKDQGLTVLEVVIAITIFMIGIAFVLQSDVISHKYFNKGQVRQQMYFYAAGILEAEIEGVSPTADFPPFDGFRKEVSRSNISEHLQVIHVKVFRADSPTDPEPVNLYTYRVKY